MPSFESPTRKSPESVGSSEAKTRLYELLERVRLGERITITRHGVPVAALVPPEEASRRRVREAAADLDELRDRTRPGPESIADLRDEGRCR